jgi:adenine-specific DNA-methyltransferase
VTKPLLTALVDRVAELDPALASEIRAQVKLVTEGREFGLVFNQHVPETVELPGRQVRVDDTVRRRSDPSSEVKWLVTNLGVSVGVWTADG